MTVEHRLSSEDKDRFGPNCLYEVDGVLTSISAADDPEGAAVATLGSNGVLVREPDGQWAHKAVLDAPPEARPFANAVAFGVLLVAGPIGAASILIMGKRRQWPSRAAAAVLAAIGWCCSVGLALLPATLGRAGSGVWGRGALIAWALGFASCVLIARSRLLSSRPPPISPESG